MSIRISAHAAKRAAERGISETGIRAILLSGSTVTLPSNIDPEVVIVFGKYGGKVWAIVMNINTLTVVTVRPASKKERDFHERYTQD